MGTSNFLLATLPLHRRKKPQISGSSVTYFDESNAESRISIEDPEHFPRNDENGIEPNGFSLLKRKLFAWRWASSSSLLKPSISQSSKQSDQILYNFELSSATTQQFDKSVLYSDSQLLLSYSSVIPQSLPQLLLSYYSVTPQLFLNYSVLGSDSVILFLSFLASQLFCCLNICYSIAQ